MEHVIQLTLDTPFVLSKDNVAGREKVRQIYLDNKDVFEARLSALRPLATDSTVT
jgi:hypothetical protein